MKKKLDKNIDITVIGLGYVGLPLALELSKYYKVRGFDTNKKRIKELNTGIDTTNEVAKKKNFLNKNISFTSNYLSCEKSNIYIVTVPTPVNKNNEPEKIGTPKSCISLIILFLFQSVLSLLGFIYA